ncbi:SRPBCC domain-containing protein [Tamlana agarivorans]|uniref:SRPBCC domain-containing protein n=1 Tax=Pseudotamlana agarivorans TaxID=481183 RepID=A0ACC5U8A0_9FLAO|nr:SRPBCC domain-containing protein [Tamlana agarivorans]MBU2950544.1 SRPBCC domain-containing protein [Tamlana agarivorans]
MKIITVQTTVKAEIDRVWDCWTKPEHILNWNFASDTWCCPKADNDLKPNGQFSWRMEAKDGSMGFDFTGTYVNIIKKELITYKMADGRFVKITFSENEDEIMISETFDAEGTHADEQQRTGWQAIIENFKKYVEKGKY